MKLFYFCFIFFLTGITSDGLAQSTIPAQPNKTLNELLDDRLVVLNQKKNGLVPYDLPSHTEYFLVYYSAQWCGPCKQFTPKLVDFYKRHSLAAHHLEVIFISRDFTQRDMQAYMEAVNMPFPALAFDSRDQIDFFNKLAGSGIPDLILLDRTGRILASSFDRGKYNGPEFVLNQTSNLLKKLHDQKVMNKPSDSSIHPGNLKQLQDVLDIPQLP